MKKYALILALAFSSADASPLADTVKKHQMEWMIGKWGNGQVHVSYEWRLDQHAIAVKFTSPDRDAEGMITLKPGTQDAIYAAVDSLGGMTEGKWVEQHEHATLKIKHTDAAGQTSGMALEHIKGDNSLKLVIFKLDDKGEPEGDGMEVELKRE